ncbi:hypothetical protein AA3271_1467 [Gluconobacter japonicus NBRC 3271]|nr:hypothetical protein AA3271_1467 [Gluconobacter japonicus NBRC 3271]
MPTVFYPPEYHDVCPADVIVADVCTILNASFKPGAACGFRVAVAAISHAGSVGFACNKENARCCSRRREFFVRRQKRLYEGGFCAGWYGVGQARC